MTNRSFARRICRGLSKISKELLEEFLPQFSINLSNPYEFIPEKVYKFLEIGFGMGDNLLSSATSNPDQYFIGADPYKNGIVKVLKSIKEFDLKNVLIWPDDVTTLLPKLPDQSLNGIYVLFPDPWPKKRHNKRRLMNEPFISVLISKLVSGGGIYFASDIKDYSDAVLKIFLSCEKVAQAQSGSFEEGYFKTKYHKKAEDAGSVEVTLLKFIKL